MRAHSTLVHSSPSLVFCVVVVYATSSCGRVTNPKTQLVSVENHHNHHQHQCAALVWVSPPNSLPTVVDEWSIFSL